MAIRRILIQDWDALTAYAAKWDALANSPGSESTIYQTFEWHASWWKAFGSGHELLVMLLEQDGALIGVAPLMVTEGRCLGLPCRTARLIGSLNYASDYCDLITDPARPEAARLLVSWIVAERHRWHRLEFFNLPSHTPHRPIIESEFRANGLGLVSACFSDAPTRVLGDVAADAEALNKKSLKRHLNHFQKSGELSFSHCESREEALSRLGEFFQQHIERRALTKDPSQFLDPRQQAFYRDLVTRLPAGTLRFSVVTFNGKPLAFHFGFEFGGRFIWYKPSFAVEHLRQSPGEVLLRFLLEYAVAKKLKEFDFTVGGESFKYRFANLVRTNHRVAVFSRAWDYRISAWGELILARLRALRKALRSRGPV